MNPDQFEPLQQTASLGLTIGLSLTYLVIYLFGTYVLAKIGQKLGWPLGKAFLWALIPIVNIFYILKLGERPWWWVILVFIPIVNLVILALVWMRICTRLGKPDWWGVLVLIPFVNFIILLILAFGKTNPNLALPGQKSLPQ